MEISAGSSVSVLSGNTSSQTPVQNRQDNSQVKNDRDQVSLSREALALSERAQALDNPTASDTTTQSVPESGRQVASLQERGIEQSDQQQQNPQQQNPQQQISTEYSGQPSTSRSNIDVLV